MSIFHKFKKAVVSHKESPTASLSPEYDTLRLEFESMHDAFVRLQSQILSYKSSINSTWQSAHSLSIDFSEMLGSSSLIAQSHTHPYAQMADSLKSTHDQLIMERERLDTMLDACLIPLKEQFAAFEAMRQRMVNHDSIRAEVVYYGGKVSDMRKAREHSSKPQSASDAEKYDRNVKKLMDVEASFSTVDRAIVADLKHTLNHRIAVLGPIMLAFAVAERTMIQTYSTAMNGVQFVDSNQANSWLRQHQQSDSQYKQQQQHTYDPVNNPPVNEMARTSLSSPNSQSSQYNQSNQMNQQPISQSYTAMSPPPTQTFQPVHSSQPIHHEEAAPPIYVHNFPASSSAAPTETNPFETEKSFETEKANPFESAAADATRADQAPKQSHTNEGVDLTQDPFA